MKIKKVTKTAYESICPKCGKPIIGQTEDEVKWNYDIHIKSHVGEEVQKS